MYALCFGPCILCKNIFGFNPMSVPSIMVEGSREPVCKDCHARANATRKAHGLEPWPEPKPDAYEAIDENEIVRGN